MTTHAILYDPDCGFCRVCVAVLLKWDRRGTLRPVSLTSTEGAALLEGMRDEEQMASWHLVDQGLQTNASDSAAIPGRPQRWSAGAAFPPLFRLLPGGAPIARVTNGFPEAAERAYRWVADHRSAFGKPLPDAAKRWADRVISESAADSR